MKQIFVTLCTTILVLLHQQDAHGQSIGPSTLNATGGTNTVGSYVCDWSVGEMTMVATFYSSTGILTQGVLQNDLVVSEVPNTALSDQLKVFPNPASTLINLEYTAPGEGKLGYRLMDMAGRTITGNSTAVSQGAIALQIDVAGLADASYLLVVYFITENDNQSVSFKIDKLK